jgi:hypothetical protein
MLQLSREVLPAAARKAGQELEECFFIIDLQNFGYALPSSLSG